LPSKERTGIYYTGVQGVARMFPLSTGSMRVTLIGPEVAAEARDREVKAMRRAFIFEMILKRGTWRAFIASSDLRNWECI
jgi:hypothetical protein